jgi:mRNA interferase MazF
MGMVVKINRFEVWLVELDPTIWSELKKTRPCLVISSNEINTFLNTIIIAPLTSSKKWYPTRVKCTFDWKDWEIALDQIRTLDKVRFIKKIWIIDDITRTTVSNILQEMFML